jgi:hypothetical protein
MKYRDMKQLGMFILLIFQKAQSGSFLIAGLWANQNNIVQDVSDMSCTTNLGVVTPDCSGGGKSSCMDSLNPAIVGVYINSMVMDVLKEVARVQDQPALSLLMDKA